MKKIMLKDLFSIRKGKKVEPVEAPSDDTVRYIQIEDLRDNSNPKFCLPKESYVFANKNHIIIAWDGANAGTVSYGLEGAIGSTLAILETREKNVFIPYVGKFLQSKNQYLRDTCTGATIPHISRKALENIVIPLPSVERQKYISNTLDKAKSLIVKRKAQIEALDQLTQSVFLEMFGDPVTNNKSWNLQKLSDTGVLKRGKSKHRPRNAPELLGGPYPLIQTGDISNSGLYIKDYHQTYSELGLKQSKMWPAGTLCITIAANIAETGILTFDACFPDSVVAYLPNSNMSNIYVHFWFSFLQRIIEAKAPESAQKNINLKILSELDIPVPPIEVQKRFEDIINKIESKKELLEKSLLELENNFNSIMQRAFKGELFTEDKVSNF